MMDVFMTQVDVDRILFSSGAVRMHSYWPIAQMIDYQPPPGAKWRITDAQKRKILGENAARIYGIDIASRRKAIANDRWSRALREHGLREPYIVQRTPA
jgi:hypothetical protein